MTGLSFNDAKTSAGRQKTDSYKIRDGENKVRFVGPIVARRIYWVQGPQGKRPVECLAFNRATQEFDNSEKDWVKEYYPDLKSEWAYASLCVDMREDEPKILIFNHKKKLFDQIRTAVADLGDPSDLENGWTVIFDRKKNGPKVFNVEYTLNVLRSSKTVGPVSEELKAAIEAHPTIDQVLKRPTADEVQKFLKDILQGGAKNAQEGIDDEIPDEFT